MNNGKRKTLKATSQWISTMHRGFVWTVLKHEQIRNVGTDYFVQRWIPYGWNKSMEWIQEAGQTKKHVGQSATSRRKRHGQPRGTERQMMCDRGPLIDRHLTPEGKEHGQPRQANHRISQKNTENAEIYNFRISRTNSSFFTYICLLRSKKIWKDLKRIFGPRVCNLNCGCLGRTFGT